MEAVMNGSRGNSGSRSSHCDNPSLQRQIKALETLYLTKKQELEESEQRLQTLEHNLEMLCGRVIYEELSQSAAAKIRVEICRSVCGSGRRSADATRRGGRRANGLDSGRSRVSDSEDNESRVSKSSTSNGKRGGSWSGSEDPRPVSGIGRGRRYSSVDEDQVRVPGNGRTRGYWSVDEDAVSEDDESFSDDDRALAYICADVVLRSTVDELARGLRAEHRVKVATSSERLMESWTLELLRREKRGRLRAGDVVVLMVGRLDATRSRVFELRDQMQVLMAGLRSEVAVVVVGVTERYDLHQSDKMNTNIKRLNHWLREVVGPWAHRAGFVDVAHLGPESFNGQFLNALARKDLVAAVLDRVRSVQQRCLATCGNYGRD